MKTMESILRDIINGYKRSKFLIIITFIFINFYQLNAQSTLSNSFQSPPDGSRPWVFWFWINGNITKEGITADLEAMKDAGIGGVLWMEVSGSYWAPDGPIEPNSQEWHEAFQWAISESRRLDLQFDMTFNFGYGGGGTWITPENSMQKLVFGRNISSMEANNAPFRLINR